jgi:hypothetical protein
MRRRLIHWLHPLLFAAFPVLFLWSHNLDQGVPLSQVLITLGAAMSFAIAVVCLLQLFLKDPARSAVAASVIVIVFLNLGRLGVLPGIYDGLGPGLVVAEVFVLCVATIIAVRKFRPSESLTRTLNAIGLVLVVLNVVPILAVQTSHAAEFRFPSVTGLDPSVRGPQRDVYYLIFDRYGGADTLRNLYGFDNGDFYDWLSARGFDVVEGAVANYPQTSHSLASSLNISYLDGLARAEGVDSSTWRPIWRTLQDSSVARTFEAMGYKYDHIGSWWGPTAVDPTADDNPRYGIFSEFMGMFLATTAIPPIEQLFGAAPNFEREAWDRIPFQVGALQDIASDPAPTFTFAHFLLPHPPYVFHADGTFVWPDPDRPVEEAYIDQLRYTNAVIERIVTELQAAPGPAPIIVLQSDEGPHPPAEDIATEPLKMDWAGASDLELGRKLRILNAYSLPGDPAMRPYPGITPVNTFRVILNAYFGAHLRLLPDRTYVFADFDHPYNFVDVTDRVKEPH